MRQIIFALALQAVASTVLLGLGGWLVISGQLTLGQLVAAELIVAIIVGSFSKLGKHMESFYDLLAGVDELGDLFDLPLEHREGLLHLSTGHPAEVSISNVVCSGADGRASLGKVDLHIQPGQRLMLRSGGGDDASALCELIFDLRQPDSGHITINQVDSRSLRPDVLRKHVALIRDIEVFEGTIAENVHLERPDISSDDVLRALEDVGLLTQVLQFPKGLETQLAPGGSPLTANQCRLLMLARAIVGRPSLLLIDGVLDGLSDDEMLRTTKMLADRGRPWTLLVASERAALEQHMDQIVRFGGGGALDDAGSGNSIEVQRAG
jgi:ABC-type bacteriocin/lantibiotic exporter with double-glycine peptidase domain